MRPRPFTPVAWYCVRVDHVVRPRALPPVLMVHDRAWAYCRSGASAEEHSWAPTRGVPLRDLYRDPSRASDTASPLTWADGLHEEIRETVGCSSCVFEVAREPTPLRIGFDEPDPGDRPLRARASVELADDEGAVGRVTITDRARERFTDPEVELLRAIVGPYVKQIREHLRPAGTPT